MILTPRQFGHFSKELGAKVLSLTRLQELGLTVPAFVAIPSSRMQQLIDQDGVVEETEVSSLVKQLLAQLPSQRYAVRSSALAEDGRELSLAGQFSTELDVAAEDLSDAISEVLEQAYQKLKGKMDQFSFFVQEYIAADCSGVTFTRNPLGGREMITEIHEGRGDALVSGVVTPLRKAQFWHELDDDYEVFKTIEQTFKWPQDVEWCEKDGKRYFLQTRPITSLTEQQYQQQLVLDKLFEREPGLFYEKTGVSEVVGRPTPFMMDLLDRIYAEDGPVQRVYHRLGVRYIPSDFLKKVGSDLYIDRKAELQSVFPALSYTATGALRIRGFSGWWRTFLNALRLRKLKGDRHQLLQQQLKRALSTPSTSSRFSACLDHFLADYELVFEINVFAEYFVKRLETILAAEPVSAHHVLACQSSPRTRALGDWQMDGLTLVGNSLDIADESPFRKQGASVHSLQQLKRWWNSLSAWKKQYLTPVIKNARRAQELRERGRWLTVMRMTALRQALYSLLEDSAFTDVRLGYFLLPSELTSGYFSRENAEERKADYLQGCELELPYRLSSFIKSSQREAIGVSPGSVVGKLISVEELGSAEGPVILRVASLTPDLVQYFDAVDGIVAEHGGLLSHLAILARERGVPVVVGQGVYEAVQNGQQICLDGDSGDVTVI